MQWVRKFLAYRRQTGLLGEPTAEGVKAFLTRLAMVEKVSASTFNTESGIQRVAAPVPGDLTRGHGRNGADGASQARSETPDGVVDQRSAGIACGSRTPV